MYTVLIVEDDPVALKGLEVNIPWAELGIEVMSSAQSGEEGLQRTSQRQLDICVLDIRLPGIDGIDTARRIREHDSRTQLILVTAHKDFAYAQRAIPIGVVDFILKPVQRNKLLAAVATACEELDRIDETRDAEAVARRIIRYDLIRRALQGRVRFSDISESKELQRISRGISVVLFIRLGSLGVDEVRKARRESGVVADLENAYRGLERYSVTVTDMSSQDLGVIISSTQVENTSLYIRARELGGDIVEFVRERYDLEARVGIGNIVKHVQDLSGSFQRAKEAVDFCGTRSLGNTVAYTDIMQSHQHEQVEIDKTFDNLIDSVGAGNESEAIDILQQELSELVSGKFSEIRKTLALAFARINRALTETAIIDVRPGDGSSIADDFWIMTEGIDNVDELIDKALQFVRDLCRRCQVSLGSNAQLVARRAALLIYRLYDDKNLSLTVVAEQLGVSECRLSTIFKEEQGVGFSHFVRRIRVKKAEELLNATSLPIYDIADHVGYENAHYFSTCFRKELGVTPSDVRETSPRGD